MKCTYQIEMGTTIHEKTRCCWSGDCDGFWILRIETMYVPKCTIGNEVINLGLPVTNAKCPRLDITSDGLASECLDEDLHPTTEAEDGGRFLSGCCSLTKYRPSSSCLLAKISRYWSRGCLILDFRLCVKRQVARRESPYNPNKAND